MALAPGGNPRCSSEGLRISKRVEVKSSDGQSTEGFIPRLQAVREVQAFHSDWDDQQKQNYLIRRPKSMQGKLGIWKPVQSGFGGPLVLQFV